MFRLLASPDSDYITLDGDVQCLAGSNIHQIINAIYPNLQHCTPSDALQLAQCAILTTTNECVDRINAIATDTFPGDARVYLSADSVSATGEDLQDDLPVDFLNTLTPKGNVLSSTSIYISIHILFLCICRHATASVVT